jgi:hypothetical protein
MAITPTGKILKKAAEAVDATSAWEFMAVNGSIEDDHFELYTISRGPIPLVQVEVFDSIKDRVTLEADPTTDSFRRTHVATYIGDAVGLDVFVEILTRELDHGAEGNISEIDGFMKQNPLAVLEAFLGGNQE